MNSDLTLIRQFLNSASGGNLPLVESFLNDHPELIDVVDPNLTHIDLGGRTALSYACAIGRLDIVNFLLVRGSQAILTPNTHGSLPLHWAATAGRLEVVKRLVEENPSDEHLLWRNQGNKTALWYAVNSKSASTAKFLMRRAPAAILYPQSRKYITQHENVIPMLDRLFSIAIRHGIDIRSQIILHIKESIGKLSDTPISQNDFIYHWLKLVPKAIEEVPIAECQFRLDAAIRYYHRELFELLLSYLQERTELSWENISEALFFACFRRQVERVQMLLQLDLMKTHRDQILFRSHAHPEQRDMTRQKEDIILEVALQYVAVGILEPILDLYAQACQNPFYHGQVYLIVVEKKRDYSLLQVIANQKPDLLEVGARFLSRICSSEERWNILSKKYEYGYTLTLEAMKMQSIPGIDFLVGLGFGCLAVEDRYIQWHNDVLATLQACNLDDNLIAKADLSDEDRLKIRHRVYFTRSLTARLCVFA